jgi:nicotinamidase-related amidase
VATPGPRTKATPEGTSATPARATAKPSATFVLELRRRRLVTNEHGMRMWVDEAPMERVPAWHTAVLVCDMWDRHWSSGASYRVEKLAPRIDAFCKRMRGAGALIVHAPSDTMAAYGSSAARTRIAGCGPFPAAPAIELPPLPVNCSDGGSDTVDQFVPNTPVWQRQHPAIHIDEERDVITDNGSELAAYLTEQKRSVVLMTGVHTNLCVLRRSFGLVALVGHGFSPVLVADLTDAMYNPADPPYVEHDAGTDLIVRYIEAFVAPSTRSDRIVVLGGRW